jgi:hypothetical protein
MAQATDYNIANQSGANFRAELNTILAAAVSQNSGSTEPTTTYAFQLWIDTGASPNPLLKIRNAANSAFITIGDVTVANLGLLALAGGTLTGALLADDAGTALLPAIAFDGDPDTGIFRAGANQFGIATNAVERVEFGVTEAVFNDGGADYDFRVEGDTKSELLLVDASADAILLDGDLTLKGQADLRFADSDSSHYIALQAPATVAANVTLTLPAADGTASQALSTDGSGVLSFASFAALTTAQSFTAQQRGAITALTDGATITPDFSLANNFSVTLGGGRILANPTNQTAGASGCIWITQDGTGSRTLAYGSNWDFTGGTAPTLTTTAAAVDCLVYSVQSSTKITATLITNLS